MTRCLIPSWSFAREKQCQFCFFLSVRGAPPFLPSPVLCCVFLELSLPLLAHFETWSAFPVLRFFHFCLIFSFFHSLWSFSSGWPLLFGPRPLHRAIGRKNGPLPPSIPSSVALDDYGLPSPLLYNGSPICLNIKREFSVSSFCFGHQFLA